MPRGMDEEHAMSAQCTRNRKSQVALQLAQRFDVVSKNSIGVYTAHCLARQVDQRVP